jgi:DNA polymerase III epsilon subunit-like protein
MSAPAAAGIDDTLPRLEDYRSTLLIFMDTETTGRNVQTDEIIELAARVDPHCKLAFGLASIATIDDSRPSDTFTSLIMPMRGSIPAEATNIHHITMQDMKGQMTFGLVMAQFFLWLRQWMQMIPICTRVLLVAHNNHQFDKRFILRQLSALEKQPGTELPSFVRFGDSLPVFQYLFEKPGRSFKLEHLHQWITRGKSNISKQTHRAADDVDMLIETIALCPERAEFLHRLMNGSY